MAPASRPARSAVFGLGGLLLALLCAFFVFYTARLLYVTRGLSATRAGGQGAYVGAVAFPLLAVIFGWGAWRCMRAARRA
ncbi:MAG TPA: hypothetical protein VHU19_02175 [Pyrinomonadaceae bacterium]|jgi:hypothetical protein|nr:hypothetical protein [Pyrinomonadaceae bacterium]